MKINQTLFLNRLSTERRFLWRRELCRLGSELLLIIIAPVFILSVADYFFPAREGTAFYLTAGAVVLAMALAFVVIVRRLSRLPQDKDVAMLLEKSLPDLMDSLICAVEVAERHPAKRTELSQALLSTVEGDLERRNLRAAISAYAISCKRLMATLLAVTFLAAVVGMFSFIHKASDHAQSRFLAATPGIIVTPGNTEVAHGDDLIVEALIQRGEQHAQIVMLAKNGQFTYAMYTSESGKHSFAFAGVDDDFRYYVQTPRLRSPTYQVKTYEKARLTDCIITITPPEYTNLPRQHLTELKSITVPQHSQVRLELSTNLPVTTSVLIDHQPALVFTSKNDSLHHQLDLTIDQSFSYVIELMDKSEHRIITPESYHIESIDDFAPIIQVVAPEEDARRQIDREITFSFKVNDDYGVQSLHLHYSINGGVWHALELFHATGEQLNKEHLGAHVLNVIGQVKDGDIIAYYGSATDAAQPTANQAVTEVRFIEMRPAKIDAPEIGGMGQAQVKTLQVNDLIVAQKRLIRSTWSTHFMAEHDSRKEHLTDLKQMARDLTMTSANRYQELFGADFTSAPIADEPFDLVGTLLQNSVIDATIEKKTVLPSGSEKNVQKFFRAAIENMQQAESLLQRDLPDESSPYQRQSLSHLVTLAIELEKNTPKGKGSGGEGESEPRKDPVKEENQQKENAAKKNRMNEIAASMDKLIDRQERLNNDIARNSGESKSGETQKFLGAKQDQLRQDSEKLREKMMQEGETQSAATQMSEATRNMSQVSSHLEQGQMTNASKYGDLAHQFLQRAMKLVKDQQNRLANEALWKADKALDSLRERQHELRQKTTAQVEEKNPPYEGNELADQQQQIRDDFEQFLKNLGETANTSEASKPQIADELRAALAKAESANTSSTMKRAENAARYSLWNKASDYQAQAEQSLMQMAQHVQNAMRTATSMSPEQMTQMLQQVLRDIQKVQQAQEQQAAPEAMQQLYSAIQKDLQDITDLLNEPAMDQLAQEMTVTALSGRAGEAEVNEQVLTTLTKAARLLETKLTQSTVTEQLKMTRATGQEPPDEFKKLVQKYFTKIGSSF